MSFRVATLLGMVCFVPRIRFSLRTSFLTLIVLSLIGSNLYVSWKWRAAQEEIKRLRDELGVLTIEDPTRFYIREVRSGDPLTWRWRIYVPPGERDFFLGVRRIPESGVNAESGGSVYSRTTNPGSSVPIDPMQGEYTITARIERDQQGGWRLAAHCLGGATTAGIMPPDSGWLSGGDSYLDVQATRDIDVNITGFGKTESFAADETVVLLRVRAPTQEQADNHELCDGVMLWFGEHRTPPENDAITPNSATGTSALR